MFYRVKKKELELSKALCFTGAIFAIFTFVEVPLEKLMRNCVIPYFTKYRIKCDTNFDMKSSGHMWT